ncbi:MAG: hypothetical protein JNM58_03035 [Xanthomonadaceae bacterium]|nr:hypothetical protein [Xanthomonadaceae bacterium]
MRCCSTRRNSTSSHSPASTICHSQHSGIAQRAYGGRELAQGGQATAEHGLEGKEGHGHADEHPPQPCAAESRAQRAAAQEQQDGQDDHGRQLQRGLGDGLRGFRWPLRLHSGEAPAQHEDGEQGEVDQRTGQSFRGRRQSGAVVVAAVPASREQPGDGGKGAAEHGQQEKGFDQVRAGHARQRGQRQGIGTCRHDRCDEGGTSGQVDGHGPASCADVTRAPRGIRHPTNDRGALHQVENGLSSRDGRLADDIPGRMRRSVIAVAVESVERASHRPASGGRMSSTRSSNRAEKLEQIARIVLGAALAAAVFWAMADGGMPWSMTGGGP